MKKGLMFWMPRIIGILAIAFIALFSFDVFDGTDPIWKKLLGLLIHNIPALIMVAVLIIAWKWELIGGILYFALFLAGCFFFRSFAGNPGALVVISPLLIAGVLFILDYARTKKRASLKY